MVLKCHGFDFQECSMLKIFSKVDFTPIFFQIDIYVHIYAYMYNHYCKIIITSMT